MLARSGCSKRVCEMKKADHENSETLISYPDGRLFLSIQEFALALAFFSSGALILSRFRNA